MSRRNKPLAAQEPAPQFVNDPRGYWLVVSQENATAGLSSLLPGGSVIQSDVAVKGRLLSAQIGWTPCNARWKGAVFTASLSDSQFLLTLEAGGDTQPGQITLLVEKLKFGALGLPAFGDTFEIQAAGKWHQFVIVQMAGLHDDNDPGLTLFLEKEQNDIGD